MGTKSQSETYMGSDVCPACAKYLDSATSMKEAEVPKPKDLSIFIVEPFCSMETI